MAQRMPSSYELNPDDPRAPSQAEWDGMTPAERKRVERMLPAEVPEELMPPEGDRHSGAKASAHQALTGFFGRIGRKVYVSGEMNVYYPGEPRFAPDLFAVLDVEPHERERWLVSEEGKGLDVVIEVHHTGSRDKDYRLNVERYAHLGIPEYFLFDCRELRLHGFRLPAGFGRTYRPIAPQGGCFASEVLGLDLRVEGARLRFLYGEAPLPDAHELVAKLGAMVDDLSTRHRADAEQATQQIADLERRLAAEAQRAEDLAKQLAAVREENDRLKRRG
jgi:Uma2 family endonuclease